MWRSLTLTISLETNEMNSSTSCEALCMQIFQMSNFIDCTKLICFLQGSCEISLCPEFAFTEGNRTCCSPLCVPQDTYLVRVIQLLRENLNSNLTQALRVLINNTGWMGKWIGVGWWINEWLSACVCLYTSTYTHFLNTWIYK